MLVVTRYRVSDTAGEADGFLADARIALDALAARPGFRTGRIGRAADDPTYWTIVIEWEHVGAYRRALSAYDVKLHAVALLSRAIDEPSAYEVLVATDQDQSIDDWVRGSDRARDADVAGPGGSSGSWIGPDLGPPTRVDGDPADDQHVDPSQPVRFGDPEVSFEELYAAVGADLDQLPWSHLTPRPVLVSWLDTQPRADGQRALVIACGLGDDAEELVARGYRVTAFDVSPTAIDWCRRRFKESPVDYLVADLLALPDEWRRAYDLVVEIQTIQSLPPSLQRGAIAAIAGTVATGGRLFVRCALRADDEPARGRPWPLRRSDLDAFVAEGLREISYVEEVAAPDFVDAVFER